MALKVYKQYNLEPKQVFHTVLTVDGMTKKKGTQALADRRMNIMRHLQVLYSNACRRYGISEKQVPIDKISRNEDVLSLKNCPGSLSDLLSLSTWKTHQVEVWEEGLQNVEFVKAELLG